MYISTETPSGRFIGAGTTPFGDAAPECDLCGREVRPETAFERTHRSDDGVEIVPVCRECELGDD
jgi:hypothetical protein